MKDTEIERVGVEFKNLLRKIQTERIKKGVDETLRSRRRICKAIVKLYEINGDFREILLTSDMPKEEKE